MLSRDLSGNGKLRLTGVDRARFLHGMVTNDVLALHPGSGCHAAMLTIKGKLLGDLRIYCDAEALLVELDPAATAKVKEALAKHVIMDDVEIEDLTARLGELGLFGDGARAAIEGRFGGLPELPLHAHVSRDGVRIVAGRGFGEAGYRLFGGTASLGDELGGERLDDAAAEIRRVEAGEPRYGVDMGEEHLPIESRLDETISFTKGCYLGQEVIVRATQQGRINRRLMGLRFDGALPLPPGTALASTDRLAAALVTSAVLSLRHGPIGLAYVHRTAWTPGTPLHAGERVARVAELPFTLAV